MRVFDSIECLPEDARRDAGFLRAIACIVLDCVVGRVGDAAPPTAGAAGQLGAGQLGAGWAVRVEAELDYLSPILLQLAVSPAASTCMLDAIVGYVQSNLPLGELP